MLITLTLLVIAAGSARAGGDGIWRCEQTGRTSGVNLSWGETCWSDTGHSDFLAMPCDANTGRTSLTVSFALDHDLPDVTWLDLYMFAYPLDDALPLPDWWNVKSVDGCRSGALTVSTDFSSAPNSGCTSPWTSLPEGGIVGCYEFYPHSLRLELSYGSNVPKALSAGVEYYLARVEIGHAKTIGPDACSGCSTPVLWFVDLMILYRATIPGPGNYEVYQAGLGNLCVTTGPAPVPARGPTWGAIKSLYR